VVLDAVITDAMDNAAALDVKRLLMWPLPQDVHHPVPSAVFVTPKVE